MTEYIHKVQYYETDKMGITHHSNYIRWMEEARVAFLEDIGWGFDRLEEMGLVSPVAAIHCDYKSPTVFCDKIAVSVKIKEYRGVKLVFEYEMKNLKDNRIVLKGNSTHCFLDRSGKFVHINRQYPEFDSALKNSMKI